MSVPDYQSIMLPLLQLLSDGQTYTTRDLIEKMSDVFKLNDSERKELLPSGQQHVFDNRVGWARTYLKKAGLVESDKIGTQKITTRGLDVLKKGPKQINVDFLEQFPEFIAFKSQKSLTKPGIKTQTTEQTIETPEEIIEEKFLSINNDLIDDLLEKIKSCSPDFFEKLVVDLIVAMGYGGSRQDAGKAVGRSGDGGIDGIIKEDRLGLDAIYLQAKRWENAIPIKEIRDFAGALLSKKARKGIFISTSQFPASAYEYVQSIEPRIILIDGKLLANMMIEYGIGIETQKNYKISKINNDYFEE